MLKKNDVKLLIGKEWDTDFLIKNLQWGKMTIKNARTILVTMCGEENIEEKPMKKINNFFRSEYVLYGNCTQFVCFDFDKEGRILNVRHNK